MRGRGFPAFYQREVQDNTYTLICMTLQVYVHTCMFVSEPGFLLEYIVLSCKGSITPQTGFQDSDRVDHPQFLTVGTEYEMCDSTNLR